MKQRSRRGATAVEYAIVAALLSLTSLSLAAVGTNVGDLFTTGPCVSEGKDPKKCGIPRSGATCRDGTSSKSTGRGACSRHGGVKAWTY